MAQEGVGRQTRSIRIETYNPGQNCRDNSCFSPSPQYNVDFSRSPKSIAGMFQHCLGERGRKKGSERRTNVAHITMEACTVHSLLFAQNLTSVPKCFDPDCSSVRRALGYTTLIQRFQKLLEDATSGRPDPRRRRSWCHVLMRVPHTDRRRTRNQSGSHTRRNLVHHAQTFTQLQDASSTSLTFTLCTFVWPTPVVVDVAHGTRSTLVDTRMDCIRIETDQTGIRHWMGYSLTFPHLGWTICTRHTIEQSVPII